LSIEIEPSSVYIFIEKPRGSRTVSAEPLSPARNIKLKEIYDVIDIDTLERVFHSFRIYPYVTSKIVMYRDDLNYSRSVRTNCGETCQNTCFCTPFEYLGFANI